MKDTLDKRFGSLSDKEQRLENVVASRNRPARICFRLGVKYGKSNPSLTTIDKILRISGIIYSELGSVEANKLDDIEWAKLILKHWNDKKRV